MPSIKKELRNQIKTQLASFTSKDIHERSIGACDLLIQQPEYQQADVIMVFLSLSIEINTTSLVLRAWQDSKRVLSPRVSWEQRRIIPVEIRSLSEDDLEVTQYSLRQPTQGEPIPISMIDLVVVPGLGFDQEGNRLGRGRGFYDRFLANLDFNGISCALAFEEQVVESIPKAPHDIRVDMLATDTDIRRFKSA